MAYLERGASIALHGYGAHREPGVRGNGCTAASIPGWITDPVGPEAIVRTIIEATIRYNRGTRECAPRRAKAHGLSEALARSGIVFHGHCQGAQQPTKASVALHLDLYQ